MNELSKIEFGTGLRDLKKVENPKPINQGKPITDQEIDQILDQFKNLKKEDKTNKEAIADLMGKFGRGRFSIFNILKKHMT